MTDLAKAARAASRAIAKMNGNGRREGSDQRGMAWGDVVAVNNQFVDVMTGGTVSGSLRYTTACDGIAEGDRVLIQHVGREPVVVGIVSKGAAKSGELELISVSAVNDAFKPMYSISGGWLALSGRVKVTANNSQVADLSDLVDDSAIPPSGINRSFACLMYSASNNNGVANVFLTSSGVLSIAQSGYDWVDLSGVILRARK